MPVREITPVYSDEHMDLVRELAAEWSHPAESTSEPVINIERDQVGAPSHIYVVWSRWTTVERIERSEIVMEAARVALPPSQVENITIAMGLTPDEAPLMGIPA